MVRGRGTDGRFVAVEEDPDNELQSLPGSSRLPQEHEDTGSAQSVQPEASLVVRLPVNVPPQPKKIAKLPMRASTIVGVANASNAGPTQEESAAQLAAMENFWGTGTRSSEAQGQQSSSPARTLPPSTLPPPISPMRLRSSVRRDLERLSITPGGQSQDWLDREVNAPSRSRFATPNTPKLPALRHRMNTSGTYEPSALTSALTAPKQSTAHVDNRGAFERQLQQSTTTTTTSSSSSSSSSNNNNNNNNTNTNNGNGNMAVDNGASQAQAQQQEDARQTTNAPSSSTAPTTMGAAEGAFQRPRPRPSIANTRSATTTSTTPTLDDQLGVWEEPFARHHREQRAAAMNAPTPSTTTSAAADAAAARPESTAGQPANKSEAGSTVSTRAQLKPVSILKSKGKGKGKAKNVAMPQPEHGSSSRSSDTVTTGSTLSHPREPQSQPPSPPTKKNSNTAPEPPANSDNNNNSSAPHATTPPPEPKEKFLALFQRLIEEQEQRKKADEEWSAHVAKTTREFKEEFPNADEELMAWRAQRRPPNWRYEP